MKNTSSLVNVQKLRYVKLARSIIPIVDDTNKRFMKSRGFVDSLALFPSCCDPDSASGHYYAPLSMLTIGRRIFLYLMALFHSSGEEA